MQEVYPKTTLYRDDLVRWAILINERKAKAQGLITLLILLCVTALPRFALALQTLMPPFPEWRGR